MQRERQQEQVEHDISMEENAGPLMINKLEVNLSCIKILIVIYESEWMVLKIMQVFDRNTIKSVFYLTS